MASTKDDDVVRMIQAWMRDAGKYNGPIDGDWGPLSAKAWSTVNRLQVPSNMPTPPAAPTRAAGGLRRIIMHWTAGSYLVGDAVKHYHYIIDGDGRVVPGNLAPEDNISTADRVYTPHTLNANTGAIGVSMACMAGAKEAPFQWGDYPIRDVQVDSMVDLVRNLATRYGIPVDRRTILSHAEVQPTLGITQRGKWDIAVLPGMTKPTNPITIGDALRARIAA